MTYSLGNPVLQLYVHAARDLGFRLVERALAAAASHDESNNGRPLSTCGQSISRRVERRRRWNRFYRNRHRDREAAALALGIGN